MVSYANCTDPKHFNMTFYDSLGVFKPIFGDFDFFGFLYTRAAPAHAARKLKSSKIVEKHQKYVKISFFSVKRHRRAVKKRQKHIFRVF